MKIAIFGGTGDLGRGLAITFAAAGHEIIVGSRSQERADQAAEGLREAYAEGNFVPMENAAAAAACEMAVLSIPYEGIEATMPALAEHLADKVLVSVVNALKFGKSGAMIRHSASFRSKRAINHLLFPRSESHTRAVGNPDYGYRT